MISLKDQPKVAIVILAWNNYLDTKECIDSVLQLSYTNYEIIIVDNKSTDDSFVRLTQDFPNLKFIQNSENLGFSYGYNAGIKYAVESGARYILLINNDVVLPPNYIEPLVEFMEKVPRAGIIGSKIYYYHHRNLIWAAGGKINWIKGTVRGYAYKEIDTGQYEKIRKVDYIPGAVMMVRNKVFEAIGLLPECYFLGGEEADFAATARKASFLIYYVPYSYCFHKVGISSQHQNKHVYNRFRNRLMFLERNLSRPAWYFCFLIFWIRYIVIFEIAKHIIKNRRLKEKKFLAQLAIKNHKKEVRITEQHLSDIDVMLAKAGL